MIVVYAYVCGDILHKGHIEHLRNCKALGDKLVVGVLTDEAVMEKKSRPAMDFDERFDLIRALEMVDVAVAQDEYEPIKNIAHIRPDILVESMDHKHADDRYIVFVKEMGIRVMALPYYPNHSSTELKAKINEAVEK